MEHSVSTSSGSAAPPTSPNRARRDHDRHIWMRCHSDRSRLDPEVSGPELGRVLPQRFRSPGCPRPAHSNRSVPATGPTPRPAPMTHRGPADERRADRRGSQHRERERDALVFCLARTSGSHRDGTDTAALGRQALPSEHREQASARSDRGQNGRGRNEQPPPGPPCSSRESRPLRHHATRLLEPTQRRCNPVDDPIDGARRERRIPNPALSADSAVPSWLRRRSSSSALSRRGRGVDELVGPGRGSTRPICRAGRLVRVRLRPGFSGGGRWFLGFCRWVR